MSQRDLERWIGGGVIAALVIGAIAITFVGDFNPLAPKQELYVRFQDVKFLGEGNVVRTAGLSVGLVDELTLTEDGVIARLAVDRAIRVHEGYRIMVRPLTVLGGQFVDIVPGDERRRTVPGTRGVPLVGSNEVEIGATVGETMRAAEPMLVSAFADVRDVMEKLEEAQGTLGKLLSDPELAESWQRASVKLERTSAELERMSGKMSEGAGTLGRLIREPRFAAAYEGFGARLESIGGKVGSGRGPLGALATDDELGEALSAASDHLGAVLDALARQAEDWAEGGRGDRLREDLAATVENVSTIVRKVSEGNGPLLVLLRAPDVEENLRRTREHLDEFAARPENSTAARLLADRQLLQDMEQTFYDWRESGFDTAEIAPVSPTLEGLIRARIKPAPRPGLVSLTPGSQ